MLRKIKSFINTIRNILTPGKNIRQSKSMWDDLAKHNAKFYVNTDNGENVDEESLRESGKSDYDSLILKDDVLVPSKSKSILEVGCGIGRITEFMTRDFDQVYGTDISEEMIKQAKARLINIKNIEFVATDGQSLPFPDEHFNAIFSFTVFQHMPNYNIILRNFKEINRTLKKGGIAKIQLRGVPTKKRFWFYGVYFNLASLGKLLVNIPNLKLIQTKDEGLRYFWVWLEKV